MTSAFSEIAAADDGSAGAAMADPRSQEATLRDIAFASANVGWAVGDHGTIWHTNNGGRDWQLQASGTTGNLAAISFQDETTAWAIGGNELPWDDSSRGVVLFTENGGRDWQQLGGGNLPRLYGGRFSSRKVGVVFGARSQLFPTGVAFSRDGGQSWKPISLIDNEDEAPLPRAWHAGSIINPQIAAFAGSGGRFGSLRGGGLVQHRSLLGGQSIREIRIVSPTLGWAIGDGGLILKTNDLGGNWATVSADLPEGVSPQIDFQCLATAGDSIWIAGTPGTMLLHSDDAGESWRLIATGLNVSIHAVHFVDTSHGFAAGGWGALLETTDGGKTWQPVQKYGERAALLGFFPTAEDVPLALLAHEAALGARSHVAVVFPDAEKDQSPDEAFPDMLRTQKQSAAFQAVGAATMSEGWRFALPPELRQAGSAQIRRLLNERMDGGGLAAVEEWVVREIRRLRPAVIMVPPTNDSMEGQTDSLADLLTPLVLSAIEAAADPTRHVDLAGSLDLPPWQVRRVVAVGPAAGSAAARRVPSDRVVPGRDKTLAEVVHDARGLLATELQSRHAVTDWSFSVRSLYPAVDSLSGVGSLLSGLSSEELAGARRSVAATALSEQAQQRIERQQQTDRLLAAGPQGVVLASHTSELVEGLDDDRAARTLFRLAGQQLSAQRWDAAAETYERLVATHPQHDLARPARIWLMRFYAAAEHPGGRDMSRREEAAQRAIALGKSINNTPAAAADPRLRVPLATIYRHEGLPAEADRYFLWLARSGHENGWKRLAQTERWLAEPSELPPSMPLWTCRQAATPPHLDGVLDEPFWHRAKVVSLGEDKQNRTELRLSYDKRFLYLAIRAPGGGLPQPDSPKDRTRDEDLSAHDHVRITLDLDRDLATWYALTVDERGHTHDACWLTSRWNPRWFVAAHSTATHWHVEAAIPLAELSSRLPGPRDVWAIAAMQDRPGQESRSWTGPASITPEPANFGLLVFE